MRQCLTAFFSGRVQGVGFRYIVKQLAHGFEVTGAVKNMADGRVRLDAEGEFEELSAFLRAIRDSEIGVFIKQVDESRAEATGQFRGFEIVR